MLLGLCFDYYGTVEPAGACCAAGLPSTLPPHAFPTCDPLPPRRRALRAPGCYVERVFPLPSHCLPSDPYPPAFLPQCDACGSLLNPTELINPKCKLTGACRAAVGC